ncbi:MAG: hypothetical protein ACPGSL_10750 [Vicingaceae bacterium]
MKLKPSILFFTCICFFSCSNLSPNKEQVESVRLKFECYRNLVQSIVDNELLLDEIIQVRDSSNSRGKSDPVTVDWKFKLIELKEIRGSLDSVWKQECLERILERSDFRGIRVIEKDLIIVEIDKFYRHTLTEQFGYGTVEIHRLIFSNKKIDRKNFYFGTEKKIWEEKLDKDWRYEVSQIKGLPSL